jgi:hypothetical protein
MTRQYRPHDVLDTGKLVAEPARRPRHALQQYRHDTVARPFVTPGRCERRAAAGYAGTRSGRGRPR